MNEMARDGHFIRSIASLTNEPEIRRFLMLYPYVAITASAVLTDHDYGSFARCRTRSRSVA